ncbi:LysR substrate-binding domain-containing protein [Streptomyces aquilus]|uniref:LysR substrate-binding domain-containing protein n=1 Tax=Streptomyces aquilus TaxID=2548456 RepID=UPI0010EC2711|nr:LysR substrate-binding domain-containing protein [Streptomyces aquilus]
MLLGERYHHLPDTTLRGIGPRPGNILHACHKAGFTPTPRYVPADNAARLALAPAGLATALVLRTAIDPAVSGIRTTPIQDRSILRLLFAATRHTETANPTTTAVISALPTATRPGEGGAAHLQSA